LNFLGRDCSGTCFEFGIGPRALSSVAPHSAFPPVNFLLVSSSVSYYLAGVVMSKSQDYWREAMKRVHGVDIAVKRARRSASASYARSMMRTGSQSKQRKEDDKLIADYLANNPTRRW
jgi:hypothetical protein